MCLAQGPQRSDAGEARTRGPSVSSQALYHWATALRPYVVIYRTDSFMNWSARISNHGNHFKASGQVNFKYLFTLLSNKLHHNPSNFWICCCMRNKLCHRMVIFVMFKWYKRLHYKKILPIYWMTLVIFNQSSKVCLRDPFWDQSFSTSSSMTSFISLKTVSFIIMQMIIRYHTLA